MTVPRPRRSRHAPSRLAAIVVVIVSALMVWSSTSASAASPAARPAARRPNIVFVLTDDLSWNLINEQFAPHIMQRASFVLVAKAEIGRLRRFARRRGWDRIRLLSCHDSTFNRDLNMEARPKKSHPIPLRGS